MKEHEDAYGRLLLAFLEGDEQAKEIVERDDRFIQAGLGPSVYFDPFRRWPGHQRRAMRLVRGRVLDVGAGAGRVALHLQDRGHDVVAIDISPLAVEVCRRRGVRDARVCRFEDVDETLGRFDTVVMFGNNFGFSAAQRRRDACFAASTGSRTTAPGSSRRAVASTRPRIPSTSPITNATAGGAAWPGSSGFGSATAPTPRRGSTT